MAFWFLWVLITFTMMGNYQMRYVAMATPPCYVLIALVLKDLQFMRRPAILLFAAAIIVFHALTIGYAMHPPAIADLLSIFSPLPK